MTEKTTHLPAEVAAPSPDAIAKADLSKGGAIQALIPNSLDDAFRLSKALAAAGEMVPKHFQGRPEATMAAIVRGMEIGLAPMQALSSIAVINGRASIWGDALPALLQRAGHQVDSWIEENDGVLIAHATLVRGDTGQEITRSFSQQDAQKAGLWSKQGPWQQYPRRMLQLRARTLAARDGAADALMGLQVAEEVRDYPKDVTPKEPGGFAKKALQARGVAVEEPKDVTPDEDLPPATDHWTDKIDTAAAFPGDDAFTEGVQACQAGDLRIACPYEDDEQAAASWLGGWDQAKRNEDAMEEGSDE